MVVVIVTPTDHEGITAAMLPATARLVRGAFSYRLYHADAAQSRALDDYHDLSGSPLIEIHHFTTQGDAEAWISGDVALRTAAVGSVQ